MTMGLGAEERGSGGEVFPSEIVWSSVFTHDLI
jgi:hypothetical protein